MEEVFENIVELIEDAKYSMKEQDYLNAMNFMKLVHKNMKTIKNTCFGDDETDWEDDDDEDINEEEAEHDDLLACIYTHGSLLFHRVIQKLLVELSDSLENEVLTILHGNDAYGEEEKPSKGILNHNNFVKYCKSDGGNKFPLQVLTPMFKRALELAKISMELNYEFLNVTTFKNINHFRFNHAFPLNPLNPNVISNSVMSYLKGNLDDEYESSYDFWNELANNPDTGDDNELMVLFF